MQENGTLKNDGTLTIRGVSTAHVAPDSAEIKIDIVALGSTPDAATANAANDIENVKKALKKSSLPVKALRTMTFEVVPNIKKTKKPDGSVEDAQDGYLAKESSSVRCSLRNGNYLRALEQITKMNPSAKLSLSFGIKNTKTLERALLRDAAKTALSEGKALAKSLNSKIVGIQSVEKVDSFQPFLAARKVADFSLASVSTPLPIQPADIDLSISVLVTFKISTGGEYQD